jgi:hypothetical protein
MSKEPKLKSKTITKSNAKSGNGFSHLVCGGCREGGSEEQLSRDEILAIGSKPASFNEQDALLDGS